MASYVPNSAPWTIWSWAPGRVAGLRKNGMHGRHQEIEELWNTCRHKEGGKGYWQRYNCFRNIPVLVSMQETCNTNSFKSLGQQSHVLSSQFITPALSRTLLWLREGVLLLQTLLQLFLKRGKRFHKCFPLIYCCYHFHPPDYSHSQPMWKIRRLFKIKWWWFWAERT